MKANEMAGRCACGKELLDRDTWQCGACARKDVARRAEAGIEGVQRYRRDGETERDFIARLESECPQSRAMLDRPGAPGRLGCPACEWTNPYTLRESLRGPVARRRAGCASAQWRVVAASYGDPVHGTPEHIPGPDGGSEVAAWPASVAQARAKWGMSVCRSLSDNAFGIFGSHT